MPKTRSTKIGRIRTPLDVRNQKDIPDFENMLSIGPLTVVLVYADWCGHCHKFRDNMWNEVSKMSNKSLNTASVHYDMLDKTSLANSSIEGYPSLLLVGTDKKPADFKTEEGTKTNAMPQPSSVEELKTIVQTPVPTPVKNANSVVNTILNNTQPEIAETMEVIAPAVPEKPLARNNGNLRPATAAVSRNVRAPSFIPEAAENLGVPPDALTDLVESQKVKSLETAQKGGAYQRAGGLMSALLEITREAAPAAGLLAAATLMANRKKYRKTRSNRRSSRKTLRRRR